MLTKKQQELLLFIKDKLAETGVSPSFDEMKEALDLKSKSGIHRLITALEERGFIRRLAHRARALEVLRLPEAMDAPPAQQVAAAPRFEPTLIQGGKPALQGAVMAEVAEAVQIPLYGRIAAGTPIEALRDTNNMIDVPASMLRGGEHYALQVAGDSMIEAGVFDGDTIVIERCDTAENGTIVVALIDNQEATLKRLRRKAGSIALEPANANYETRIYGPDQVKVQGRLVGLLRRY